jgi:hypothetical protein
LPAWNSADCELLKILTLVLLRMQSPRGSNKGLLSPKRKSDISAFQAFMTPQKRSGAHRTPLLRDPSPPF